ncbi:MAG TPA: FKBP-type peptidyl-prolyl cis-trans isomerase, partial [Pseudomonadales bacterium]|nr:FKBP-type peptidyl-prolyl cis-trans isomerase [Pseudomonadales bacterium]
SKEAEKYSAIIAAGKKFLEDNAKRPEVTVTASGLQYEILTAGSGAKPKANSTVRTHYHGTLINGQVFDSSVERGQPAEFPVNGVIRGWTEALQLMEKGAKWRLYLPYELAYGERGAGGVIGPYSTLIFDVELIDIL